ncbi:MAG: hypothetical protein KatS3mg035_1596 [Bacteroidia bacterium]|nr:MAG: hypothetical protein KatS3mg035_1596 [Bacteroidia bacterium]
MKKLFIVLFVLLPLQEYAQDGIWRIINEKEIQHIGLKQIQSRHSLTYALEVSQLKKTLLYAPHEEITIAEHSNCILELPFPDGSLRKFRVSESPIMHPDLASKYPGIKTFAVRGWDDPYATGRIDYTYQGFHAMIQTLEGTLFIDPYNLQTQDYYTVYWKHDFITDKVFECLVNEATSVHYEQQKSEKTHSNRAVGPIQRKYRTGCMCHSRVYQFSWWYQNRRSIRY